MFKKRDLTSPRKDVIIIFMGLTQGDFDRIIITELQQLQGNKSTNAFAAEIGVGQSYLSKLYRGKTSTAWLIQIGVVDEFLPHLIQTLREARAEYKTTPPAAPDP